MLCSTIPCTSLACRCLISLECLRNRSGWTCSRNARRRRGTYADVPTVVVFIDPTVVDVGNNDNDNDNNNNNNNG